MGNWISKNTWKFYLKKVKNIKKYFYSENPDKWFLDVINKNNLSLDDILKSLYSVLLTLNLNKSL